MGGGALGKMNGDHDGEREAFERTQRARRKLRVVIRALRSMEGYMSRGQEIPPGVVGALRQLLESALKDLRT